MSKFHPFRAVAVLSLGIAGVTAFGAVQVSPQGQVDRILQQLKASLETGHSEPETLPPDFAGALLTPTSLQVGETPATSEIVPVALEPLEPPEIPAGCSKPAAALDAIAVGDTLRLQVFERSSLAESGQSIAFERLDLGGNFIVASDGTTAIPLVGRLVAAERSLPCFEAEVARALFDELNSSVQATVGITARQPVIVEGTVPRPGTYTHSPGMTVERLLSLAGVQGGEDPALARQRQMVASRVVELERAVMSTWLEAQRVSALLKGRDTILFEGRSQAEVQTMLGQDRVEAETAALRAELAAIEVSSALQIGTADDLAEQEAEALAQLQTIEEQLSLLKQRHENIMGLQEQGVVSASKLDEVAANLMAVERARFDMWARIAQIQSAQRSIEREASMEEARRQELLTRQLRDLAEERNLLEGQLASAQGEQALLVPTSDASHLSVRITRPGQGKMAPFIASLTTTLRPGDVVEIATRDPLDLMELAGKARWVFEPEVR